MPEKIDKNALTMPGSTKKAKTERGKYLTKRINDLFKEMNEWLKGTEQSIQQIKTDIDSVKIPAAKIFSVNKEIAFLKPTGLWGFGVNIQIEIEAKEKGNFIFDIAKETADPDWTLIYRNGRSKKLTKMIFRNFLKKIIGKIR